MFNVLDLKKQNKMLLFFFLIIVFSFKPVLSSEDEETSATGKRKGHLAPLSSDEEPEEPEEDDVPQISGKLGEIALNQKTWDEKVEEMALSWRISKEEYLGKMQQYFSYLRRNKRTVPRKEKVIMLPRPDIEGINRVYSAQYKKVFTEQNFPMFKAGT